MDGAAAMVGTMATATEDAMAMVATAMDGAMAH